MEILASLTVRIVGGLEEVMLGVKQDVMEMKLMPNAMGTLCIGFLLVGVLLGALQ